MSTQIAEYSTTDAALAELRTRYADMVYTVETPFGMARAKEARAELRGLRVDLEKTRKQIKAPALERCRLIDDEAKRITSELSALEDPIDAQIKKREDEIEAEKARKAEAERQRVAAVRERIDAIKDAPRLAVGKTFAELQRAIVSVEQADIADLEEMEQIEARVARLTAVKALREMIADAEARAAEAERLAAERAALEAQQAELRREQEAMAEQKRQQADAERAAREAQEARERAEAQAKAAEAAKAAAAERARQIREATLHGAATEAHALLCELGQADHITTEKLAAALGREQIKEAA